MFLYFFLIHSFTYRFLYLICICKKILKFKYVTAKSYGSSLTIAFYFGSWIYVIIVFHVITVADEVNILLMVFPHFSMHGNRYNKRPAAGGSLRGARMLDTAEYLIQNSPCICVAVQRKGQNGGFVLNTKTHRNFWLLA